MNLGRIGNVVANQQKQRAKGALRPSIPRSNFDSRAPQAYRPGGGNRQFPIQLDDVRRGGFGGTRTAIDRGKRVPNVFPEAMPIGGPRRTYTPYDRGNDGPTTDRNLGGGPTGRITGPTATRRFDEPSTPWEVDLRAGGGRSTIRKPMAPKPPTKELLRTIASIAADIKAASPLWTNKKPKRGEIRSQPYPMNTINRVR